NNASNNRAKQFEQDVIDSFRNAGAWVERFPDKLVYRGPGQPPIKEQGPPDLCALHQGRAYLVECKSRNLNAGRNMEFRKLHQHQLVSLLTCATQGGKAYIAVLWYGRTNASPETVALMIPVQVWHRMKATLGKQSFNIDD